MYLRNPKTKGSGIVCAIPQTGVCPIGCADCFFQSGRSYLEPLGANLPNLPPQELADRRVVRVNDGNDSNVDRDKVIKDTEYCGHRFFNTSIPTLKFPAPVVLTLNPADMTDVKFHKVRARKNLMFVRFRTNLWNLPLLYQAIEYYSKQQVTLVITWMAYHEQSSIPIEHQYQYDYKQRTTNSYWVVGEEISDEIAREFVTEPYVDICCTGGSCQRCGVCLREYWRSIVRMGK